MLSPVQKDYRKLAADYNDRWKDFSAPVHDWVLDRLNAPASLLDLGCGTGLFLGKVSAVFPQTDISGVDISADMLTIAEGHVPQVRFFQGDIEDFSIQGCAPHVIVCLNVLHHLNDPDAFLVHLAETVRVHNVQDIYLCDFAIEGWKLRLADLYWNLFLPSYNKAFRKSELRQKLKALFEIRDEAVLCPDEFWRLQIYRLAPKSP